MKKFTHQLLFFVGLMLACAQMQAQTQLSIQGTLKKTNDQSVDDGPYDLTFKLYAVATGGTALWSETQTGLLITGGIYSAQLGAVTALNIPFDAPYFLGVTVNGKEMSPRTALTAAPYALALSGSSNEFPGSGNVGIGTLNPTTGLDANSSISTGTTTTSAAAYTVAAADHVIFLDLAGAQAVTLPSAATFPRREIVLINKTSTAKTVSSYIDLAGAAATAIPANGMIELRSNGSEWRLATTYVPSAAGAAKAYVLAGPASGPTYPHNAYATIVFAESQDAQNCFASNTFTAPRTGYYQVGGSLYGGSGSWPTNGNINVRCGGTCAFGTSQYILSIETVRAASTNMSIQFNSDVYMTAGQTLFLQINQSSGASAVLNNLGDCWFSILEQ